MDPMHGATEADPADPNEAEVARDTARDTSALSDEDLIKRVRGWYSDTKAASTEARDREAEDERMYSGHQWAKEDLDQLKQQKRPALTLNFVLPLVNAVTGEERLNRQEIKVYGRDSQDDAGSYVMSELIRWVMDECYGEYAVSKAFRSACITGRGWVEVRFSTLDDPMGKVEVLPVPAEEIYLDHLSTREDASDARYMIREKWVSEDEIAALWPDKIEEVKNFRAAALSDTGFFKEETHSGDPYRKGSKLYNPKDSTWQVLETWHWEVQPGAMIVNPDTGIIEEVTEAELEALLEEQAAKEAAYDQAMAQYSEAAMVAQSLQQRGMAPPAPLPPPPEPPAPLEHVRQPIKTFFQSFVCGTVILSREASPVRRLKRFPYVPVHGYWDKEKGSWFGLVRPIVDAQRQHNVEQSAILHMTQTQPKSGWIGPKGSFHDKRKWESESAKPGFIGEYNPSRGKPERIDPPNVPRHIVEMAGSRLQTMRDISGVNQELIGMSQKDTAGVVMELRRKAGLTVLAELFDNLRLARRVLGEVLIAYVQHYITDGRQVRVMGPRGAQYVQAASDLSFNSYDAVVEDASDTPTDKMATMYIMQTVLPMVVKAGMPVPPSFVDLLPISQHVKDEWRTMLQAQMGMGAQPGAMPGTPPAPGNPSAPPPQPAPGGPTTGA